MLPVPRSPLTKLTARLTAVLSAAALLLIPMAGAALAEAPPKRWTEKSFAAPLDADAPVSMRAFSKLAKELSPAVVSISVHRKGLRGRRGPSEAPFPLPFHAPDDGGRGLGSGFIVHADGYILTNHHVIEDADEIRVHLSDETEHAATVIGSYKQLDVALVKIKPKRPLTVAALGDSASLEIGEWVIAIGNPFGLSHTVTAGIVSAKGRRDVQPGRQPMYANFIQTDASINPGNSGGPLINIRGEVVGINTAINRAGQGIGFAVPINMVKTVLPQLAHNGRVSRSYLGVQIGPLTPEHARSVGLSRARGSVVREVMAGTPADVAGLRAGDVITHWDGQELRSWQELSWRASNSGTKRPVKVKLKRGKRDVELAVRLTAYPDTAQASAPARSRAAPPTGTTVSSIGIRVGKLPKARTDAIAKRRGSATSGVLVLDVDRGSAADGAGLEAGDIVVQVNYDDIQGGPAGFAKAVGAVAEGQVVSLLVIRGDRTIFVAFTK